jgi:phenylpropionate dioxygenase-like ring-hydroxylating dioxygenase large terminal subunit
MDDRGYPFTWFPASWYRVAGSDELRKGAVRPLRCFGQDLVLWRDHGGQAHVLDAYCPHLGTHLGHGGTVVGDALECPLHGWRFDGGGDCVSAPLARNLPRATMAAWPVQEVNGSVLVWFDAAKRPPSWYVPELPEYVSPEWSRFHAAKRWRIKIHVQDMGENGMDMAHFPHLHRQQTVGADSLGLEIDGATLTHHVIQHHNIFGIGRRFGVELKGTLDVTLHGLGFAVNRARVEDQASLGWCVLFYFLPLAENLVEVRSFYSVRRKGLLTLPLLLMAMREGNKVIDQDVPIWENKRFRARPYLSDADGPIMAYRRWAQQFYGEAAGDSVRAAPRETANATNLPYRH